MIVDVLVMILGIDHGYYAIKTRNCSFPAGITPFGDREPYTRQNVLTFGGCFFVCGSGRQPIQRDKTANDNYYLLTLAAIAKEIEARGAPRECSVTIAAGLPLTSYGREKPAFRKYLLRNAGQPTEFGYEGREEYGRVTRVSIREIRFPNTHIRLAFRGFAWLFICGRAPRWLDILSPFGSRYRMIREGLLGGKFAIGHCFKIRITTSVLSIAGSI